MTNARIIRFVLSLRRSFVSDGATPESEGWDGIEDANVLVEPQALIIGAGIADDEFSDDGDSQCECLWAGVSLCNQAKRRLASTIKHTSTMGACAPIASLVTDPIHRIALNFLTKCICPYVALTTATSEISKALTVRQLWSVVRTQVVLYLPEPVTPRVPRTNPWDAWPPSSMRLACPNLIYNRSRVITEIGTQ